MGNIAYNQVSLFKLTSASIELSHHFLLFSLVPFRLASKHLFLLFLVNHLPVCTATLYMYKTCVRDAVE